MVSVLKLVGLVRWKGLLNILLQKVEGFADSEEALVFI